VAAYRRFSCIRQVVPVCTPPNTCFLWPTRVHIQNATSIGSATLAQLTAESRYTLHQPLPPLISTHSHGDLYSPSNTWFLGPTWILKPNGICIGSAVFAQLTGECPYTLQWAAPSPSKLPLPIGRSGPHLTHDSLGRWAHPSLPSKRHLDRFSRFCRAHYCDRQTDRPRYSVCNNRPHLRTQYCDSA